MTDKLAKTQATLRAAEQALEDAIARQTQMAEDCGRNISQVVHDIKNPLTAMIGFLSLIRDEFAGPLGHDTYAKYIRTVDQSATRLLNLCNSLLHEYNGPHDGHEVPERKTDVGGLLGEIGDLFAAQAREREVELSTTVTDAFPQLEADPDEMFRALTNLVSNALKFTPKGGKVEVQADLDPKDNTFIMVVRDSGVGMTREQIDKVLTGGLTTISPHGDVGTGQGLGIVNRIVSGYGGKLDIISTENRGTRIKLKFPKKISIAA